MKEFPSQSIRYFNAEIKKENSDSNIYGLALAYSQNNNLNESEKLINILVKKYPKNLFLNTSKIEILTKAQKYDEALKFSKYFFRNLSKKLSSHNY